MTTIMTAMKNSLPAVRRLIKEDLSRSLSQAEVASKVGISQSAVFKYLETDTEPSLDTLKKFSRAYGVPLQELIEGKPTLPGEPIPPPLEGSIPVISLAKGGAEGFFDEQGYPVGEGFRSLKRPYDLTDPNAYGVEVRGDSMVPRYDEKDVVIASPRKEVVNGDYVVAKTRKGEVMVKRIRFSNGMVIFESVNQTHPPIILNKEDVVFYHKIVWVKPKG